MSVIGYPLKRSLSPVFQQAALDHLKLDIRYEALPTPGNNLSAAIQGLRAPEWLGENVERLREPLLVIRYAEYQEYFFALFLALYLASFYLRLRRLAGA